MHLLLATAIGTGMLNTMGTNLIGGGYNYRETGRRRNLAGW